MTLTALPLYDYQRQDLDALAAKLRVHQRVALVLPTGGGKTVCFAHQAMEHLAAHPDGRVLILVDTDELVWQTHRRLADVAPHLKTGIVKAASNEVHAQVIVASVQTLRKPLRLAQIVGVTLVIVDECEMAVTPSCLAIIKHFDCTTAGYTATLMRSDSKSLALVWQDAVANRDIAWMIRNRWLINIRGKAVVVPDLDLRNVASTRADYREGELGEALAESLAPELVAKNVREHARDRKTLAFFPTIESCRVFAEAFVAEGIEARVIHGGMTPDERKAVLAWHRPGTVLVNCMLLTKGYDDPKVNCIVMGRPTKSKRLYIQIVGRGVRRDLDLPWEDQDCLLLDVVGAAKVHDLRSIVDLSEKLLKEPRDGRTLIELEDEFDDGGGIALQDAPTVYTGPTVVEEFDPLGRPSTKVWLKTAGGNYFLPAGTAWYVFIMQYPEVGLWSVAMCPTRTGKPEMTAHRGLPLDEALVWAEDLAITLGADLNTTNKKAPWRKKVASEKLVTFARGLNIPVTAVENEDTGLITVTERMGALSDKVTLVLGTRRIDPLVRAVQSRLSIVEDAK